MYYKINKYILIILKRKYIRKTRNASLINTRNLVEICVFKVMPKLIYFVSIWKEEFSPQVRFALERLFFLKLFQWFVDFPFFICDIAVFIFLSYQN